MSFRSTKVFLLLVLVVLTWIYVYGISENPLTWEEPRRCLVALEMIFQNDYVVPRLLGEPYRNKPPLQNWLLILLSGKRAECIGPLPLRMISILALLGTMGLIFVLWADQNTFETAWIPVLLLATMGILVQYGRSGETDSLFMFWVVAALCCFQLGRRRTAWLKWGLSQSLLAGGILTKGIAPLFFYPPALYCAWKDRSEVCFSKKAFFLGLAMEVILVAAWLIPYAQEASLGAWFKHFSQEIVHRSPYLAMDNFLLHFISFPLEVFGNTLPWSLLLGLLFLPGVKRSIHDLMKDDLLFSLSAIVFLWAFLAFWLMPGARGRYLIPVYPFTAILLAYILREGLAFLPSVKNDPMHRRYLAWAEKLLELKRAGWVLLACLWTTGIISLKIIKGNSPAWQVLLVGLICIGVGAYGWQSFQKKGRLFVILAVLGLLYGVVYAGITSVHRAHKNQQAVRGGNQIASLVLQPFPVVCGKDLPYGVCFYMSHHLRRPLCRKPAKGEAFYLVDNAKRIFPSQGIERGRSGNWVLWEIHPGHRAVPTVTP